MSGGSAPASPVLLVHPHPDLYGSGRIAAMAASVLRDAGHDVRVRAVGEGPFADAVRALGLPCDTAPFPVVRKVELSGRRLLRLVVGFPLDVWRLRAVLRRTAPALVLVNTIAIPHWIVAARLAGVRCACYVHEDERRQSRVVQYALAAPLLLCTSVVTVSASVSEFVAGAFPRLRRRTLLVHNAADFPERLPPPAAGPPFRLGLVGRLSHMKGQDVAIEALKVLRGRGLDVELELVGDVFPGYEAVELELAAQARAHGVDRHVTFAGFRADPWRGLSGVHVVLVPSRNEPFGLVAVEAMAAGRPVVASDVGGLREIVRDGVDGVLVPAEDPEALADAVQALLLDTSRRERLGEAAQDVRVRFSADRYAAALLAALAGETAVSR